MTQEEVARHAGIPIATYRRLERGEIENPRIGWLTNCAYVLDIEPSSLHWDYRGWTALPNGPEHPPDDPVALHREGRFPNLPAERMRRGKVT